VSFLPSRSKVICGRLWSFVVIHCHFRRGGSFIVISNINQIAKTIPKHLTYPDVTLPFVLCPLPFVLCPLYYRAYTLIVFVTWIKQKPARYFRHISPANKQSNTSLQPVTKGFNTGIKYNQNPIRIEVRRNFKAGIPQVMDG